MPRVNGLNRHGDRRGGEHGLLRSIQGGWVLISSHNDATRQLQDGHPASGGDLDDPDEHNLIVGDATISHKPLCVRIVNRCALTVLKDKKNNR